MALAGHISRTRSLCFQSQGAITDYNSAVGEGRLSSFLSISDRVQSIGRQLGYGVGDDMDVLLAEFD
jgi:hypothetical protein